MSERIELKPCPWCGGGAEMYLTFIYYRPFSTVGCRNHRCPTNPETCSSEEEGGMNDAIEAWNTRHQPEPDHE